MRNIEFEIDKILNFLFLVSYCGDCRHNVIVEEMRDNEGIKCSQRS